MSEIEINEIAVVGTEVCSCGKDVGVEQGKKYPGDGKGNRLPIKVIRTGKPILRVEMLRVQQDGTPDLSRFKRVIRKKNWRLYLKMLKEVPGY